MVTKFRHKVFSNKPKWVYALVDPRDSRVRYIGCSCEPEARLKNHMAFTGVVASWLSLHRTPTPVQEWLFHLSQNNEYPLLVLIELVPFGVWRESETEWILKLREAGADLTNISTSAGVGNLKRRQYIPGSHRIYQWID